MKKIVMLFIAVTMCIVLPVSLMASTSAQKQAAIDAGLSYLASTQQADGSWNYGGYEQASTAGALLSFVEQSYKPLGWNGQNYSSVVTKATNYLLSTVQQYGFSTSGNWWNFGQVPVGQPANFGLEWTQGGEDTYITGLAIPALSRLVTNPYGGAPILSPSAIISGTGNSLVDGKTYAYVIQKAVDSFTYGQTGPANGDRYGGWRYFPGQQDSDMSTTQWAVMSYLFAGQVPGVNIPGNGQDPGGNVKTGLKAWLVADQYTSGPNAGGSDYQPNQNYIINNTHAGAFLLSNYFAGGGGDKALALQWLNAHWKDLPSSTWWGNDGQPYAMWAVYKALETLYGTTGVGPILPGNLNPLTTGLDPGVTYNWWEDYCQYLVGTQNADGSWSGYQYWYGPLATAWDINILNATATVAPPTPGVPEPATLLLLGLGLAGLGVIRKKM